MSVHSGFILFGNTFNGNETRNTENPIMIHDSRERYGALTKLLHWSMALLVFWQLLKFGDRIFDGEHWVGQTLVPWHISIGSLMLLLILALLTSSILLPALIVAFHEFSSRITGSGSWLDYEESGTLSEEAVLDAVIE